MNPRLTIDAVIFGGGVAGLWLLDDLTRAGYSAVLLEARDLGSGQTIASQGIIHGGLKYTLGGWFTPSARAIRDMPVIWRRCIAGENEPNLSGVRLRAEFCHLWRTTSLRSRLAMIGAKAGLRIAPVTLPRDERPAALANCPGTVARLDEQVIDPTSLLTVLSQPHASHIIKIDVDHGLEFDVTSPGHVQLVRLINPDTGEPLDLEPRQVILAAGAGNQTLGSMVGLPETTMQRRPLHMVMAKRRGRDLPILNAHCVDGRATRVTITSTRDFDDRVVWQIGGQIAERGVNMTSDALIPFARSEFRAVLPDVDLAGAEWATYRIDRAEAATRSGMRPDEPYAARQGNTITAWPTKMALVPEMVRRIMALLEGPSQDGAKSNSSSEVGQAEYGLLKSWPRPLVALPPWETHERWTVID